jgi:superfamily II DNA or RNA helicase
MEGEFMLTQIRQEKLITKPLGVWPAHIQLRTWQKRALQRWLERNGRDFLLVSTPGSGKTLAAAAITHQMLIEGQVDRIVVVCHTEHLCKQWADVLHQVGIDVEPRFQNGSGVEKWEDFHGIVITYQQVSTIPALYAKQCLDRRTLVIFDEIHHVGDDLAWGNRTREAFEPAEARLSLSGTPFRHDNCQIPFVTYEEGRSKADFIYSYPEALAEGICRPVYFLTINGRARWFSRDGSIVDAWLLEEMKRHHESERLLTILDTSGQWLPAVLKAADEKLSEIRRSGHPDAGALVIAIDQNHAKRIGKLLRRVTGSDPIVAISEDPGASEKIKQVAQGTQRFLVCVRMVSEGVDIPRLRVGVYATNITTELFLRQAVGRFVRMIDGLEEQSAGLFIPAVKPLVTYARQIKEERDHQLKQVFDPSRADQTSGNGSGSTDTGIFLPIESTHLVHDVIFDGSSFSPADLEYAERLKAEFNIPLSTPQLAVVLKRYAADQGLHVIRHDQAQANPAKGGGTVRSSRGRSSESQPFSLSLPDPSLPTYAYRDQFRKLTQKAVSKYGGLAGKRPWLVHQEWIDSGGSPSDDASVEDLERKFNWLRERIEEEQQKRRS